MGSPPLLSSFSSNDGFNQQPQPQEKFQAPIPPCFDLILIISSFLISKTTYNIAKQTNSSNNPFDSSPTNPFEVTPIHQQPNQQTNQQQPQSEGKRAPPPPPRKSSEGDTVYLFYDCHIDLS